MPASLLLPAIKGFIAGEKKFCAQQGILPADLETRGVNIRRNLY
jgi:hypothetical protein